MILYTEIMTNYIDGNGLVTPSPYEEIDGNGQGSDNGPMYLAEFYIMLKKHGVVLPEDFFYRLNPCIDPSGNLRRVPFPTPPEQSNRQTGPDDYLGVLDASFQFENTKLPRTFLKALLDNWGSLNNESPGRFSWKGFLIRQPQLLAAMITAGFPKWTFRDIVIRTLIFPLYLYSAGSIFAGGFQNDNTDSNSPRLGWHLVQILKNRSIFCKLASFWWYHGLYRLWGPTGMRAVAKKYYSRNHPFIEFWVDK